MKCFTWSKGQERCRNEATMWLCYAPGMRCPGGFVCKDHGREIIQEYRQKLGQEWYGVKIDDLGNPIPLTPIYRAE